MLSEEFVVIDGASFLWIPVRPFVDIAKRLEQNDDTYTSLNLASMMQRKLFD